MRTWVLGLCALALAPALSWVLFVLIMLLSVLQLRIFRYRDVD